MDLQDETVEVLSKLIHFHTVNPPGDERACQEWLADYLSDAGLEVELDGAEPERPNLVATLRGGDGPALGYLSHVDTVLADNEDWSADPWGAELRDGYLYGRGAIDMKSQTAAEAVAARAPGPVGREVRGHAEGDRVADEETGGDLGAKWITENRPDLEPRRLPAQRGRRRAHALRRPPPVRRLRGREGHVPLQRRHHRDRGARLRRRPGAERAARAGAADHAPRRPPPALRPDGGHPRAGRRARGGPRGPEASARSRGGHRAAPRAAPRRRDARHVLADDRLGGREDQRDPGPRARARRLPRPARDGRGRRARARPRGAGRERYRSTSPRP